jgi:preprotein translocase subunit SecE
MDRGGDGPMAKGVLQYRPDSRRDDKKANVMAKDGKTSPGEFFKQVKAETAKVSWPSREETIRTAIFVFILMVILSLFFLGVDSVFGAAVRWLLTLA